MVRQVEFSALRACHPSPLVSTSRMAFCPLPRTYLLPFRVMHVARSRQSLLLAAPSSLPATLPHLLPTAHPLGQRAFTHTCLRIGTDLHHQILYILTEAASWPS